MATIKTYRACFVPLCKNTTKNTPNKVFLTVPRDVNIRKKWFNAVRRDNLKDSKSNFFCCEDHFELREDMENYQYYKTMGGPAKIKKNVQPHKFACQPDRKRRTCPSPRVLSEKRRRRMEINELLEEACTSSNQAPQEACETCEASTFDAIDHTSFSIRSAEPVAANDDPVKSSAKDNLTLTAAAKKDVGTQTSITQHNAAVQTHIRPHYRSVSSMCKMQVCTVDKCTSPIKLPTVFKIIMSPKKHFTLEQCRPNVSESISTSISSIGIVSSNDYYTPTNRTSSNASNSPTKTVQDILKVTDYFISTNMKAYLGIPNEWNELINLLSMKSNISTQNIKLCLMKIRRQDTFERLAEQFCMSPSNASIIFNKTVPILRHFLQTLIYFPNPEVVTKNLPIAFRSSYSHVQSIVDALEIQIEKPSDPVNQALTWSEYKKCNTLKYLISCGPDGFINFISTGFGGRISDVLLFEKSNILDRLPTKCGVMADRGFKNVQSLLNEKHCTLIKPPSVSSSIKPTKSEVIETKRIASLRIHIERVIGRLREFDFLKPHAVISHSMLSYTDDIIVIAAALVNLHSPIIKK